MRPIYSLLFAAFVVFGCNARQVYKQVPQQRPASQVLSGTQQAAGGLNNIQTRPGQTYGGNQVVNGQYRPGQTYGGNQVVNGQYRPGQTYGGNQVVNGQYRPNGPLAGSAQTGVSGQVINGNQILSGQVGVNAQRPYGQAGTHQYYNLGQVGVVRPNGQIMQANQIGGRPYGQGQMGPGAVQVYGNQVQNGQVLGNRIPGLGQITGGLRPVRRPGYGYGTHVNVGVSVHNYRPVVTHPKPLRPVAPLAPVRPVSPVAPVVPVRPPSTGGAYAAKA